MNWNSLRAWLGTVIRLVLGAIWIWASVSKLGDPRRFVQAVRAYDATPEWLSKAMGYGMPVLELALGVLLVAGVAMRISAAVSAVLFVVFIIGVSQAAGRGLKLDCGCFGGGGQTTGSTHYALDILRDVVLLAMAVYLVIWPMTQGSIEWWAARHDYVEPPSAKRMRTPDGARKYNALVEQKAKNARDRSRYVNSSLTIVVALICVVGIGVQSGRSKITGTVTAANATVKYGVTFGKPAAAAVDLFEDYQCPHCLEFEEATHTTLEADVRANLAVVRYHPMSFLDSATGSNKYSSRAANAALCASDVSPDMFVKYHDILFTSAVQPAEGSNGRTDAQLVTYAQQAGMTPDQVTTFQACVQADTYKALVQAITEDASKRGVNATPTVMVNGKTVANPGLATLTAAIAAADAKGPSPSPSKTPTPTPTKTPTPTPTNSATPTKKATASPSATP